MNLIKSKLNINSKTISNDKNYHLDALNHTSLNSNIIKGEALNNGLTPNYSNKFIHGKKKIFLDELYKKKNIIFPFNKEINNINININGYNPVPRGLTSRTSNNTNKKKTKKNNDIQEINLNTSEKKLNKSKIGKKNINLMSINEGNPVKI